MSLAWEYRWIHMHSQLDGADHAIFGRPFATLIRESIDALACGISYRIEPQDFLDDVVRIGELIQLIRLPLKHLVRRFDTRGEHTVVLFAHPLYHFRVNAKQHSSETDGIRRSPKSSDQKSLYLCESIFCELGVELLYVTLSLCNIVSQDEVHDP